MENIFQKNFRIRKLFNSQPAIGPKDSADAWVEQLKLKTATDIADKMQWADGAINHGIHKPGEVKEAIQQQQEDFKKAQDQAQQMMEDPNISPGIKQEIVESGEKHDNNKIAVIQSVEISLNNQRTELDFDENGNLKSEALVNVISDLDGKSWIQVENGRYSISISGEQKFAIGEAQLKYLLTWKTSNQIQEMYTRLTGDSSPLELKKTDFESGILTSIAWMVNGGKEVAYGRARKLRWEAQQKIENFRRAIAADAEWNAILMEWLMGERETAWLVSSLNGSNERLKQYLLNPANAEKIQHFIQNGEILKKNPNYIKSVLRTLTNIGLQGMARVATAGVLGIGMETSTINKDELRKKGMYMRAENLTAGTTLGENGSAELSLDLVGIRAALNWNDPVSTMKTMVHSYMSVENKREAAKSIADAMLQEISEKKPWNKAQMENITKDFLQSHERVMQVRDEIASKNPEDPRLKNLDKSLEEFVMMQTAKTMELRWVKLQGALAEFGLQWLAFWLSAAKINTSYTTEWWKTGAMRAEAESNRQNIEDALVLEKLSQAKISQDEKGNYIQMQQEGKQLVPRIIAKAPGANEKIVWNITEMVSMNKVTFDITHRVVAKWSPEKTVIHKINLDNPEQQLDFIVKNSKEIIWILDAFKKNKREPILRQFQDAVAKWDLKMAEQKYNELFRDQKIFDNVLWEIDKIGKKEQFFRELLNKTSGWVNSRSLAKTFNAMGIKEGAVNDPEKVKKSVLNYYEKVNSTTGKSPLQAFSELYKLNPEQAKNLVSSMLNDNVNMQSTIGSRVSESGFIGMVAFAQGPKFRQTALIDNKATQIFGTPTEITGDMAETIRSQLKEKISPSKIESVRNQIMKSRRILESDMVNHPELSDENIKKLMVSGPVKSYLSFEEGAECFNLGFYAEPGEVEWKIPGKEEEYSSIWTGASVNIWKIDKTQMSASIGIKKDKPEEDTPNTEPDKDAPSQVTNTQTTTMETNNVTSVTNKAIQDTWPVFKVTEGVENVSSSVASSMSE